MTTETQPIVPIESNKTYSWAPDAKIYITGIEYSIFQKTLAMFEPGLATSQAIFQRMLNDGVAVEQVAEQAAPELNKATEGETVLDVLTKDTDIPTDVSPV